MEWTADQFVPDYFARLKDSRPTNPFVRPQSLYPRTVRGGGWASDAAQLRSAYRLGSDSSWEQQDPQLPKSIWYLTDAPWVGFRLARPLEIPSVKKCISIGIVRQINISPFDADRSLIEPT